MLYPVTAEMQLWTAEQFVPVVPIAPGPPSTVESGETRGISQPVICLVASHLLTNKLFFRPYAEMTKLHYDNSQKVEMMRK